MCRASTTGPGGDLAASIRSSLDTALAELIRAVAGLPDVAQWSDELKAEPIVLVIAVLAYSDRHRSRTAARIARKVFGAEPPTWIEELEIPVAGRMDCCPQASP